MALRFAIMPMKAHPLYDTFPPSEGCGCPTCRSYCNRPGWPLVEEARLAIEGGYGSRLMLEFAPGFAYGILAPAFKGNEGTFALQACSTNGCTFLVDGQCTVFQQPFRPIECRFCHHGRPGQGLKCHLEVARDWNTSKGKRLVKRWLALQGLQLPYGIVWD